MSGQLIELIIFAAIAFFVINKLLSTLGRTSEDDLAKNKSFFGESGKMQDITGTASTKVSTILRPGFVKKKKINMKGLIVLENEAEINAGMIDVMNKVPTFNAANFLKGAKNAFRMIIEAGANSNEDELEELVDKIYIENFKSMASSYGVMQQKNQRSVLKFQRFTCLEITFLSRYSLPARTSLTKSRNYMKNGLLPKVP